MIIKPCSFYCPPMKVSVISGTLRRTDAEPMTASIGLPNNAILCLNVIIPPTYVRWQRLLTWQVDACVGQGSNESAAVVVSLPPEPVVWQFYTMVAKAITATVAITLASGRTGIGTVVFPDCPINLFTGTAAAVQAQGSIAFED